MAISTKARYGLRAMIELAMANSTEPVALGTLATGRGIPRKYLSQLMATLRKQGLARSARGASGGYFLGRDPSKISALDIVSALEGSIAPVHCVDDASCCPRSQACAARDLWASITQTLTKELGRVSLADLAERQRDKDAGRAGMYQI